MHADYIANPLYDNNPFIEALSCRSGLLNMLTLPPKVCGFPVTVLQEAGLSFGRSEALLAGEVQTVP